MRGSCHCGNVTYRLEAEPDEAMACNCSICRRKGYLLYFTTPDQFVLETPGAAPGGRRMVAVNLRCADIDMAKIKITEFDGASLT
jgi:hypothetical protein